MPHKPFGWLFYIHTLLIIFWLSTPLWLSWWIILLIALLLEIQYSVIGGCIVTRWEFGENKETYLYYYLSKISPGISAQRLTFWFRHIIPLGLVLIAYLYQK